MDIDIVAFPFDFESRRRSAVAVAIGGEVVDGDRKRTDRRDTEYDTSKCSHSGSYVAVIGVFDDNANINEIACAEEHQGYDTDEQHRPGRISS